MFYVLRKREKTAWQKGEERYTHTDLEMEMRGENINPGEVVRGIKKWVD